MQIQIEYDLDTIFRDWVLVDRGSKQKECYCTVDDMIPVLPVNAKGNKDNHICANCGNIVRDITNSLYNQYWGYSGYDE